jgi:Arc/MetJ family transcription regulator
MMRTTLTIDDDVAAALERLRAGRRTSFKALVNEALRRGVEQLAAPPPTREALSTTGRDLGRCLIGSIDDTSEALAVAEGESFR